MSGNNGADQTPNPLPVGKPEWGYCFNFNPEPNDVWHEFCGTPEIPGALCPNCNKPLLRLLTLRAVDPVLELDQQLLPEVHLIYCWRCSIPFGEFSYRVKKDGSVEFVSIPPKHEYEFGPSGPYEGYSGIYPLTRISLIPLPTEQQRQMSRLWYSTENAPEGSEGLCEPRHLVGGYPFIANSQPMHCPGCTQQIPILATICDDSRGNDPWNREKREATDSFVDNGGVQMIFHLCRACSIVAAYHCCD